MKPNLLCRFKFLLLLASFQAAILKTGYSQVAITSISTTSSNVATAAEININGAGYSFSSWLSANTYSINYASAAAGDITSVSSFNTGTLSGLQPVAVTSLAKVQRAGNAAITDARNFITTWNRITSGPAAAATSGTFNCFAPKVTSMETALLTNNIYSGYDNTFQNTTASPHYNNIERVDYIIPAGITAISNLNEVGFVVFDRGAGDAFKIAAITSIDASDNATGYSTLASVAAANFSAAGLIGTAFDFTIFISDPIVAGAQHRPSTRNSQDIRGVFISFQSLGILTNQPVYGYSLFGQDVDAAIHTLTNPSTFPTNSNSGSVLDLINVLGVFKTNNVTLPVKLTSFKARYESNNVKLTWATSFEQNLRHFIIEKSIDGIQWGDLAIVNADNGINGSLYQFQDVNTIGDKYYYRIRIVSMDGSAEYSAIRLVSRNKTGFAFVRYHSSSNSLFISSDKSISGVTVLSANGQMMQSYRVPSNTTITELGLKKMLPGIYFIRVNLHDASASTSGIVIH